MNLGEILMEMLYPAMFSAVVSVIMWVVNYFFVTRKDRIKSEKRLKEVEKSQKENNDRLEKKFQISQGKEPLILDFSLISGDLQVLEVMNEKDEQLTSMTGSKVVIKKKIGWISKIYFINSCFKDKEHPIVDTANHISFMNEIAFDFREEQTFRNENLLLSITEKGNEIILTCKEVINYYSDKDWRIFYQFYLVMGSGGANYLLMFGSDKQGEQYYPFLLGKEEMISTVKTVNDDFRFEYQSLRRYLEECGIKIK